MSYERFEREKAAHYAALHERRRVRGTREDPERNDARRSGKSRDRKPREPLEDPQTYRARTQDDIREDLATLYAELHAASDPKRRDEIELAIFRIENGVE